MADIQLHELREGEDRTDIGVVETMTGIHLDARICGQTGGSNQAGQFGFTCSS